MSSKKVNASIKSKRVSTSKKKLESMHNHREKTKKILTMLSNLKKFREFYKELKLEERETLQDYKYSGFYKINKYLYSGNKMQDFNIDNRFLNDIKKYFSKETKDLVDIKSINPGNIKKYVELYVNNKIVKSINTIDKIFQSPKIQKLQGNELLYRGTHGHSITNKTSRVGNEVIFNNFISTSTEQYISEQFMTNHELKDKICCMYILTNMKDVPFIYLPWEIKNSDKLNKKYISQAFSDEFEFLLPRGLKFKISKREYIDYKFSNNRMAFNSIKKMSFDKLSKLVKNKDMDLDNLSKMDDEDFKKLFDKLSNKILTYHLEYIGQEPIEPISPYNYNSNINLHITNASSNSKNLDFD
jgi:hypothetical protein